MKIAGRGIAAYLRKPDPRARATLLYGPDQGLVRERAELLLRTAVPDAKDPFRLASLSGTDLAEDPARLADEAAAIPFFGGRRAIRVTAAGDRIAAAIEGFLGSPPAGDALVVIEAGDLAPRSALRRLFEEADNAAAIACYADAPEALEELVEQVFRAAGHKVDAEAIDYLKANLGADRGLTRSELDKLVTYMGPHPATVGLAEAQAVIGDSGASAVDDICYAATGGDPAGVEKALGRALGEGESPVMIVRAAQRHMQRLQLAADAVARGASARDAVQRLRPPVFFKRALELQAQLASWDTARAQTAIELLTEAEIDCKSTGLPDEAICRSALLRLAGAARRRRT
ncbi:DNA polymerase III subunit delta [Desertibaculum subflavum]|uniref:DNA polymerase III subunit delta n=1 Tax=Desertibaculum subflavum TaxID=2268458 RepID=UPI000E668BAB